jgi:signal peptidase II
MTFLEEFNNKKILLKKENIYLLFLIILIFFTDRISKNIIINNYSENIYFINEFINLDLIWNTGIGFGFFSTNSSLIYNSLTASIGLVIIFLFFVAIFSEKKDKIIFSIIIGGAIGNFYDRLIYNAVPDFIDLHYNKFHWFTFNIADILISIGIIFFIIRGFLLKD